MYNSLPREEDITRVYVLRPVGISNPEGILLFSLKKRKEKENDIWCSVDAIGIFVYIGVCVHCGPTEKECENKMKH